MTTQEIAEEIERSLKFVGTDILKETLESVSEEIKGTSTASLIAAYKEAVCEKGIEHLAHNLPADKLQEACLALGITSGDYKKKLVEGSKAKGLENFLKACEENLLRDFANFLKLDDGNKEELENVVMEEMMMTGMKALLLSLTPGLLKKYCTKFELTPTGKKTELVSSIMDHVFQLEPEAAANSSSEAATSTSNTSNRKGKKGKAKESSKAESKVAEKKSHEKKRGSRSTEKKETTEVSKSSKRKASTSPAPTRASSRSRKTTKEATASPAKRSSSAKPKASPSASPAKRSSSAKPKASPSASPVKKSTRTSKSSDSPKASKKSTEKTTTKRKRDVSPSPVPSKKEKTTKKTKTTVVQEAPIRGAERPPISDIKKGLTYTYIFDTWNAIDLKDFCKEKGIKSSGKKPELIKRAIQFLDNGTVTTTKKKKKAAATKKKPAKKANTTTESTTEKSTTSTSSVSTSVASESASGKKALNGSASSSKV